METGQLVFTVHCAVS